MTLIDTFTLTPDPTWRLEVEGFDKGLERSIESVMALVNGYCGTRAAVEEGSTVSSPGMFVAGIFNTPEKPQAAALEAPIPEIVVAPNWSKVRLLSGDQELTLDSAELVEQRRVLDIRQGVLLRTWSVRDNMGYVTRLRSMRFASLANRHMLAQVFEVRPDYDGEMVLESLIDARVTNENNTRHWDQVGAQAHERGAVLLVRTTEGKYELALAAGAVLYAEDGSQIEGEPISEEGMTGVRWRFQAERGRVYELRKIVAVGSSRDGESALAVAAEQLDAAADAGGISALLAGHVAAWDARWLGCDAVIPGDEEVQREVRWALYHLAGSAWRGDEKASVGARSITGERYRGHVFWDTETFVWPFHCYTEPQTARALLMYRYNTIQGARNKAKSLGYRGALFAWESTDDGEETTPPYITLPNGVRQQILTGVQEHHLAADIAYAILQYRQATQDDEFFLNYGAEMVIDIARFWASRVQMGDDGKYHINTVIGPDEYHEYTDDGAYTNVMAQWTLRRALDVAAELQSRHRDRWRDLTAKLGLSVDELTEWQRVADNMRVLFDSASGLFEQFKGYHGLEEIDLTGHDMSVETMDIVLGWEPLQKTKVLKQADVVMLIFLLWDQFDHKVHEANFRYYEPRTSHDSSLSASFHALVAARLGDIPMAEMYLRKAARIDLDFTRKGWAGATGGVHIAALGGIWQALAFGFLGMRPQDEGVRFSANIPESWGELGMNVTYQGAQLRVTGRPNGRIELTNEVGRAVNVAIGDGAWFRIGPGEMFAG